MNIYIDNLPQDTEESDLRGTFGRFGAVTSVSVIRDFGSRLCSGYAFVEMPEESKALMAIQVLDGSLLRGSRIRIPRAQTAPLPEELEEDIYQDLGVGD